ncbi:hypothetical protein K1X12_01990 [Hyphomonas sp. WL0036]|uniref:hypothetical protein n=1 Tax=Hyphomonas sediminis TaxID=2866160 RepID=UPI001C7EEA48|nr:hypothetical protein [Hyphomonas sediminis]MBY9065650.1 hypothetical protein [Hyphomonas sediminis]
MSLRGDILGWVIGQLNGIKATDPAARGALFEALRAQVARDGAFGVGPAEALPHLESAIARQEIYWLSQEPPAPSPPAPAAKHPAPTLPSSPPAWRWPAGLKPPRLPPEEVAGEAAGPYSDHIYEDLLLEVPGGSARLSVGWAFDPACSLTATAEEIGFTCQARTVTLSGALDYLEACLRNGGLCLPAEARTRIR